MLNILSLCIQTMAEDDEILDEDILQTILQTLLPKLNKRGQPTDKKNAYTLAKNVVMHCTNELSPGITQFVIDSIQKLGKGETALENQYHALICELNQIAPTILTYVLPHLEHEIKVSFFFAFFMFWKLISFSFCSILMLRFELKLLRRF